MKKLIIISLSLLLSVGAMAQTFLTQVKPYGEKLWGYANQKGEIVIKPIYKVCYAFSEDGLAPIYESKKYAFINIKGDVIEPEIKKIQLIKGVFGFGGVEGYHDGLVAVMQGKKWGYLNTDGKVAIELKYEKVSSFHGGLAVARLKKEFFVLNPKGDEFKIEGDGIIDVKLFSEGLASFKTDKKLFGFIGKEGTVAVEAKFVSTGKFKGGMAWAKTSDKKVGFINKSGDWKIDPQFEAAKDFDPVSGIARVKKDGIWTYVNKSGEIVKITGIESMGDFHDGLAKGKKDGKTGFFNSKGEWVVKPEYEGARNFKNGFAAVKKGGKWGFVNSTGQLVVEPSFAAVKDMEQVK